MTWKWLALLVSTLVLSCGSDDDGGGGNSGGTSGASGSSGAGGASGGGAVQCEASPPSFPAFDKSCTDAPDCVVALHQTDCCGNVMALGLSSAEKAAFGAAEQTCRSQYPGCGCPAGPISTEEGQTTTDASAVDVKCRGGVCTTFAP
jgi:hypothetical protein